jgi:hypothetical protein
MMIYCLIARWWVGHSASCTFAAVLLRGLLLLPPLNRLWYGVALAVRPAWVCLQAALHTPARGPCRHSAAMTRSYRDAWVCRASTTQLVWHCLKV